MNPFKVGDRVMLKGNISSYYSGLLEVTCIKGNYIGFVSIYPKSNTREGKKAQWHHQRFVHFRPTTERELNEFDDHWDKGMNESI